MEEIMKALDSHNGNAFSIPAGSGELEEEEAYRTEEERLLYKVLQAQGLLLNEMQDIKAELEELKEKIRDG